MIKPQIAAKSHNTEIVGAIVTGHCTGHRPLSTCNGAKPRHLPLLGHTTKTNKTFTTSRSIMQYSITFGTCTQTVQTYK